MTQEKTVGPATLLELRAMAEAKKLFLQRVTWVHHWTNGLFSFRIERPDSFCFRSGEFVMIGLKDGDRPLLRTYSIVSPNWEEHLEFFSVKVPEGPLTSRLQHLKVGDYLFLSKKPIGDFAKDLGLVGNRFNPQTAGVMVCGSMAFNKDMASMLEEHGLEEGSNSAPGSFVVEWAFVG